MIAKKILSFIAVAVAAFGMHAGAATVFDDNFESYTASADFEAAWPVQAGSGGAIVLQESAGNGAQGSNKFVAIPGAGTERRAKFFTPVNVGDVIDISLSGYVRASVWAGTRASFGIRDAAAGAAVYAHIGTYNNVTDNKWSGRFLGLPGVDGYYAFTNAPDRPLDTWTKLTVTISSSALKFYVDDVEDTADAKVLTGAATTAFGSVNIGYRVPSNQPWQLDSVSVNTTTANVNDWNMC